MISWLWCYWNNIMDHKQKDIQILRLTAKIQKLEGKLESIKYIMDCEDMDIDDN